MCIRDRVSSRLSGCGRVPARRAAAPEAPLATAPGLAELVPPLQMGRLEADEGQAVLRDPLEARGAL
eukprot:7083162-Alexandrium_andersonii.AAC.1